MRLNQLAREYYMVKYLRYLNEKYPMPTINEVRKVFRAICVESRSLYEDMSFWRPNGY